MPDSFILVCLTCRQVAYLTFKNLLEKQRRKEGGPTLADVFPKSLQYRGLYEVKAKSQLFYSGLPHGCKELKYLLHHLLSYKVHISRKLESRVEPILQCVIDTYILSCRSNTKPEGVDCNAYQN